MTSFDTRRVPGPHAGAPVRLAGAPLDRAAGLAILVHGRGGSAEDMLGLARHLARPDFAFAAPQAAGATWYPGRFLEPLVRNEPWLGSALGVLDALVRGAAAAGFGPERILLLGFSQGACLSLDYAMRNPGRWGGVAGLSGGLIGPLGTGRPDGIDFEGTPVFLGCSDVDAHIPVEYVREAADLFRARGAAVDERIYPGFGHAINPDEVAAVRDLMAGIAAPAAA